MSKLSNLIAIRLPPLPHPLLKRAFILGEKTLSSKSLNSIVFKLYNDFFDLSVFFLSNGFVVIMPFL